MTLHKNLSVWMLCAALVSGCGQAESAPQAAALPTITPAPTQPIPTATATSTPNPTVTPFPTVTQRPLATLDPTAQAAQATLSAAGAAAGDAPAAEAGAPDRGGFLLGPQLFTTDFSRGWPATNEETASINLDQGRYVFEIGPYDVRYIATGAVSGADLFAEVTVTPLDCPEQGGYGLIFRLVDDANFYQWTIFCNGAFSVVPRINGRLQRGVSDVLPESIDVQGRAHVLAVAMQGDTFSLLIDGQVIGTLTDTAHERGDVAVYVTSQGPLQTVAAFDDLAVWNLRSE